MLVLTRKSGETICIGDDVELKVVKTHANRVKICIAAPDSVVIRRAGAMAPKVPPSPTPKERITRGSRDQLRC